LNAGSPVGSADGASAGSASTDAEGEAPEAPEAAEAAEAPEAAEVVAAEPEPVDDADAPVLSDLGGHAPTWSTWAEGDTSGASPQAAGWFADRPGQAGLGHDSMFAFDDAVRPSSRLWGDNASSWTGMPGAAAGDAASAQRRDPDAMGMSWEEETIEVAEASPSTWGDEPAQGYPAVELVGWAEDGAAERAEDRWWDEAADEPRAAAEPEAGGEAGTAERGDWETAPHEALEGDRSDGPWTEMHADSNWATAEGEPTADGTSAADGEGTADSEPDRETAEAGVTWAAEEVNETESSTEVAAAEDAEVPARDTGADVLSEATVDWDMEIIAELEAPRWDGPPETGSAGEPDAAAGVASEVAPPPRASSRRGRNRPRRGERDPEDMSAGSVAGTAEAESFPDRDHEPEAVAEPESVAEPEAAADSWSLDSEAVAEPAADFWNVEPEAAGEPDAAAEPRPEVTPAPQATSWLDRIRMRRRGRGAEGVSALAAASSAEPEPFSQPGWEPEALAEPAAAEQGGQIEDEPLAAIVDEVLAASASEEPAERPARRWPLMDSVMERELPAQPAADAVAHTRAPLQPTTLPDFRPPTPPPSLFASLHSSAAVATLVAEPETVDEVADGTDGDVWTGTIESAAADAERDEFRPWSFEPPEAPAMGFEAITLDAEAPADTWADPADVAMDTWVEPATAAAAQPWGAAEEDDQAAATAELREQPYAFGSRAATSDAEPTASSGAAVDWYEAAAIEVVGTEPEATDTGDTEFVGYERREAPLAEAAASSVVEQAEAEEAPLFTEDEQTLETTEAAAEQYEAPAVADANAGPAANAEPPAAAEAAPEPKFERPGRDDWGEPAADAWPAVASETWPQPTGGGWPDSAAQPTWSDSPAPTAFGGQAEASSDAPTGGAAFTDGVELASRPVSTGVFGRYAAPQHGLGAPTAGSQDAGIAASAGPAAPGRTAHAPESNLWQLVDEPAASTTSSPAERRGIDPVTVFLTILVAVIIVALLVGFIVMLGQAF
jgi:hypothetical protein